MMEMETTHSHSHDESVSTFQKSKDWINRFIGRERSDDAQHLQQKEDGKWYFEQELVEDDAIYTVSLKKVHFRADTTAKQWQTIKVKTIKAGTIQKLVQYLTEHDMDSRQADSGFFSAFLCTYTSFSTPSEVVDILLRNYEWCANNVKSRGHLPRASFRSRSISFRRSRSHSTTEGRGDTSEARCKRVMRATCAVTSAWLDRYPKDFDQPPRFPTLTKLIEFSSRRMDSKEMKDLNNRCNLLMDKFTVSPFECDSPFKFKFCHCPSIIGCTCDNISCQVKYERSKTLNIYIFSVEEIANQLTLADADLFLRVSPRECLGYFWSKRDKSKGSMSKSIKLTVEQFNAVSNAVISTILLACDEKTNTYSISERCKIVEKWIDVALELRELKNFSSLKAILSSLQASPIYRLSRTWQCVNKQSAEIFEELSKIFVDDMNSQASRQLLMKEGTAKIAPSKLKNTASTLRKGSTFGTVPYLGTFLTDLMMVDTAHPDRCNANLINFQKKRKEFETIAQIKLFQEAAKGYNIEVNKHFFNWFNLLPQYNEKESYALSLKIEPPVSIFANTISESPDLSRKRKIEDVLKRRKSEGDVSPSLSDSTSNNVIKASAKELVGCEEIHNGCSTQSITCTRHNSEKNKQIKDDMIDSDCEENSGDFDDKPPCFLTACWTPVDSRKTTKSYKVAHVYCPELWGKDKQKCVKLYLNTKASDVVNFVRKESGVVDGDRPYFLFQILDEGGKELYLAPNSYVVYAMDQSVKKVIFHVRKGSADIRNVPDIEMSIKL